MKSAYEVAKKIRPGSFVPDKYDDDVDMGRGHIVTPLESFRYDHLTETWQVDRLRGAIKKCLQWTDSYSRTFGQSMIITGPFGTGKTTMAENIVRACFTSGLNKTFTVRQVHDGQIVEWEEELPEVMPISRATLIDATDLMKLIGENTPFSNAFGGDRAIIIDDAGTEDFSTNSWLPGPDDTRAPRHRRYGRFIEWCHTSGMHLIITSNVPVAVRDENRKAIGINRDFEEIFGGKAWSRIRAMAAGYMVDLTGLPDYRPFQVGDIQ